MLSQKLCLLHEWCVGIQRLLVLFAFKELVLYCAEAVWGCRWRWCKRELDLLACGSVSITQVPWVSWGCSALLFSSLVFGYLLYFFFSPNNDFKCINSPGVKNKVPPPAQSAALKRCSHTYTLPTYNI